MLRWALMARLAADSCSPQTAGSRPRLEDLRAGALGQLGNALRVCGRLDEAEEILRAGEEARARGTGDPALRAHLLSQIGSLQIARGDFGDALQSVELSARLYSELGEEDLFVCSLLQMATAIHYGKEPERAIRLLDRAISLLDPEESPDLLLIARLNRARFSIDVSPSEQALARFFAARKLLPSHFSALLLRATWQEGQMLAGLGSSEAAEAALLQAWEGYLGKGLVLELLAVSGDLIDLYRHQGNRHRLAQLARRTREALARAPLEPAALSSLQNLEESRASQLGQFR